MTDTITEQEHSHASAAEIAALAVAARGMETVRCPNCTAPVIGPFCSVCGQERDTHRRSVWHLLGDLFEDIVSFDSRILRTGVALMAEPGEIAMAFREGRPRRYVPALRLYFFVSLIFFLILNLSGLAIMQFEVTATPSKVVHTGKGYFLANTDRSDPDEPALIPISKEKAAEPGTKFSFSSQIHFFAPVGIYHSSIPAEARAKLFKYSKNGEPGVKDKEGAWFSQRIFDTFNRLVANPAALNESLTSWLPRVLFLLLPIFALLLMIFYIRRRKQFYFVDHLIFSLNMHSFVFIALIVAVGVAQAFDSSLVAVAAVAAMAIYLLVAMKRFYQQGWIKTGIKFFAIGFIYTTFFLLPAMAAVIAASIFWT
ncbi:MAG TPA: DUF3667 domain-containing protein [Rhizomicrobium sp.]|jgi:hypothetical protein